MGSDQPVRETINRPGAVPARRVMNGRRAGTLACIALWCALLLPAAAAATDINTWKEPVTGMVFIQVPAGCFEMGSAAGDPDEKPVHRICLDGFWIGKYEVANRQYRKFDPTHAPEKYKGRGLNGNRQPAVYVQWPQARDFTLWLTKQNGKPYRFSLPTEAQWEYACRAGRPVSEFTDDDPDRICRHGNVYDRTGHKAFKFDWPHFSCNDGRAVTTAAGRFKPNPWGLHDMIGNVWEWCADTYTPDNYKRHRPRNPLIGGNTGMSRVVRGGGWSDEPKKVSATHRDGYWTGHQWPWVGFRVVMTTR